MNQQSVVDLIDSILDEWAIYQSTHHGITPAQRDFKRDLGRRHLVILSERIGAPLSNAQMSDYMQRYRLDKNTKYHIVAKGYARQARWSIIDGPGFNVEVSEELRQSHAQWVTLDLASRAASDTANELLPMLESVPNIEALIERTTEKIRQQLDGLVQDVLASNELYESLTGRPVPDPTELLVLSEADDDLMV